MPLASLWRKEKPKKRKKKWWIIYYYFCFYITETPAKTATGTIAIQLENFNDHCPIVTSDIKTMCTTENSVIVNANNEDAYPNGPPFKFEIIPEGTKGQWKVEHLNGEEMTSNHLKYI